MKNQQPQLNNELTRSGWIFTLKHLKKLILSLGILIVLFILMVTSFRVTSTPGICSTCHEMTPEYVTWKVSSHNRLACTECHTGSGSSNIFMTKLSSLSLGYKHLTGKYLLPITPAEAIKDEVCLGCHDLTKRVVTPSSDVIIPHDKHIAQGITCVECHGGVTHGEISFRQQTVDGDFERWSTAMAETQMLPKYRVTGMRQCMDCHKEKKVANKCETCHKKIMAPADHKNPDWVQSGVHGREATVNIEGCDRCHSFTKQPELISGLDIVSQYARSNTFCYECHIKRPTGHEQAWRLTHNAKAQGTARTGCLVCHSENQSKASDKVSKTYCTKCHKSKHQSWDPTLHPIPLGSSPKFAFECIGCHSGKTCSSCHYIPKA